MTKLWGGRFAKETNKLVEDYTESISFDYKLAEFDIAGSIAHITMLARQKIVSKQEKEKIIEGLNIIANEIKKNKFKFKKELEDIHLNIEQRLTEIIGKDIAGKLHTARSRNDQVITDVKLLLKTEYKNLKTALVDLLKNIIKLAEKNKNIIMPGFTHLQNAQPIPLSHHLLAYFYKFKRDLTKLLMFEIFADECPLGACALAGTSHNIDRNYTAKLLGFEKPVDNSIDAVSDRDFLLDFLYLNSLIMLHLSNLSEELIIWSSQPFAFITISDDFTTGSSIMPNKKNPDVCELTRGKSARVIANLNAMFILLKALPLAYNRDLQDDKKILFDTLEINVIAIKVYTAMLSAITFNQNNILYSLKHGYLEATDIADYLTRKNVAFRTAHHISGEIVKYAISKNKTLDELTIEEYRKFSDKFEQDIFSAIDIKNIINSRKSLGCASFNSVEYQLKKAKEFLNQKF